MSIANSKKEIPAARALLALAFIPILAHGAAHVVAASDLTELSLEELSQVVVTSASRREERLIDVPASLYVITAEDIRRSGATGIVDALRLAPNLFIGRGDANQAVIGARGQYAGVSNKMLVLVDGRAIYTPLFSGIFWDSQYLVLQDIERIEVISGPAATLWGSNGVNGVINIITKSSRDTLGVMGNAFGGNDEAGVAARQGGALGADGTYRIYAKYRATDDRELASGASARDASERIHAGFRADWSRGAAEAMIEGSAYKGDVDNLGGDRNMKGGHLLARWSRPAGAYPGWRVQAYYDRTERVHRGSFEEKLDIFDLEGQHEWRPVPGHTVVSGLGYRYARDDIVNTAVLGFQPPNAHQYWANVFVQDEWRIAPSVELTGGLKAERNPYTGVEWLPNLRLAWTLSSDHLVWGALSRAVRAPSRIDRDAFTAALRTNDTFESEIANVAELGYRAQIAPGATLSLTAFYQRYPNLRSAQLTADRTGVMFANGFEGRAHGIEGWASWRPMRGWRLSGGFEILSERFTVRPGFTDVAGETLMANDPRHTATLRSSWDIGPAWEADVALRNVGRIPHYEVPQYTVVDARLGWRVMPKLDLALVVQNAFDRAYAEFGSENQRAVFRRTWLIKADWRL